MNRNDGRVEGEIQEGEASASQEPTRSRQQLAVVYYEDTSGSLTVQGDQWDTYWGAKKFFFLIRDIDGPTMTAAPVESCRFVARRCPWGRLGSVLDTRKRLHRMRRRFKHFWPISLSRPLGLAIF